jgi:type IV secretory pathway VirB9-like protein
MQPFAGWTIRLMAAGNAHDDQALIIVVAMTFVARRNAAITDPRGRAIVTSMFVLTDVILYLRSRTTDAMAQSSVTYTGDVGSGRSSNPQDQAQVHSIQLPMVPYNSFDSRCDPHQEKTGNFEKTAR